MFEKHVIIIAIYIAIVYSTDNCGDVKCPKPPKHYRELNCKPVIVENNCCASRYECPDISAYDEKKCYFDGKAYASHESLETNQTESLCAAACYCDDYKSPAEFTCAQIECGHFFDRSLANCFHDYSSDKCCPSRYLCKEEEIEPLSTCIFDGTEYKAGESIYPESARCHKCICRVGFDNSTVIGNPNCKEIQCGIELRYLNYLRNGCIPIYGSNSCCPYEWQCPKESDVIIPSKVRSVEQDSSFTCEYGKNILNIDDTIKTENDCNECKCYIPPIAHCIKKPSC